jgi:hypothetical protein
MGACFHGFVIEGRFMSNLVIGDSEVVFGDQLLECPLLLGIPIENVAVEVPAYNDVV